MQQGGVRRCPPRGGPQDPLHLGGGALRVLPFQSGRQIQHHRVGAHRGCPQRGHQGVEPSAPVAADPPVQGVPRVGHLVAERVGMHPSGDLAHQSAPRLGGQPPIQRRTDQLITEQPDRLAAFTAFDHFLVTDRQRLVSLTSRPARIWCRTVAPVRIAYRRAAGSGSVGVGTGRPGAGGQPGARSRPPLPATATPTARTVPRTEDSPKRPVIATVAIAIVISASVHGEPDAFGTATSTPTLNATPRNHTRTGIRLLRQRTTQGSQIVRLRAEVREFRCAYDFCGGAVFRMGYK